MSVISPLEGAFVLDNDSRPAQPLIALSDRTQNAICTTSDSTSPASKKKKKKESSKEEEAVGA